MVKKVKTEPPPGCIPEAEQPYKVPKNWRWVNVGSLSTYHRGVSYNKDDVHSVKHENDILILRGGNISEGVIDITADSVFVDRSLVNDNQILKKHDIVIVSSTGSKRVIGRAGISDRDYSDVAFGAFLLVVRPSYGVYPQYLDYFFLGDSYRNRIRELAKGTNINNIRTDYITQTPIPLPPLP
ncbi:MAG: restriction endonuclease subunit S, partial [Oscillibacter sp.]|nr:restriction endonuclease subunit S [Oscillibacter sp.]